MTSDVWDTPYVSMHNGYPDMHIVPGGPVYAVPWEDGCAFCFGRATGMDHRSVPIDPRGALEAQAARAEAMGFEGSVGAELEHAIGPIRRQLPEVGIPIEQSNPEYAPGQVEVNIRYGPVLATADRVVAFRSFVKELAARHGFLATFMSKPFAAESGSGFHTHYSLWSEGANTFAGPDGHLSQIGLSYLAGMQERMAETALAAATTPNAYRRRRPYTFCPVNNSWGHDNRTVGLRVIEGAPDAIRVKKRDGSAECNPYYLMACDLASGLDGIEQGLEPQHFTAGNGYEFPEAEPLPADLHTALRRARESNFLKRTLGEDRFEILAGQTERELAFMDEQVTEVEFDRYLRNF